MINLLKQASAEKRHSQPNENNQEHFLSRTTILEEVKRLDTQNTKFSGNDADVNH